jgi:hypothetical protein
MWGLGMSKKKQWTSAPGAFAYGTEKEWDYGTWRCAGVYGGGHATVNLWRYHDGSMLVGTSSCANLTPAQARQLAAALIDAATMAEAEDASPAPDIGLSDMGGCND